jgi:DNA-directed RNA polymerase
MDERVAYTESNLDNVLASARDPYASDAWWRKGDNPWQLLSAVFELEQALAYEDPTTYESNLHIHQDGSCNGLQHYAALGGDLLGARAVNLAPSHRPGDVYSEVARGAQALIDVDCENGVAEALLMKNRINRKVVKQTVMTNTYGVTFIGARDQIRSRLKEARTNESPETALTDSEITACANYTAKQVFASMGQMFTGINY